MKEYGIYIHIPFCRSRCIYCDFYSTTQPERQDQYIDELLHEIQSRCDEMPSRARTIYIGGGTPSLLSASNLQRLLQAITQISPLVPDAEVTIEANPDDVTPEWVESLRLTPVNRISMGVQSFSDDRLRFLHRRHTASQVHEAIRLLRQAGYHNLSIDLIYGLPGQSLTDWQEEVQQALHLEVPHISAYALIYEEGTALFRMQEQGLVSEADDKLQLSMYHHLIDTLQEAGYEHYEISNFALPHHYSRHNSSYWTLMPYIGLGRGAHSYDGNRRRSWTLPDGSRQQEELTATDLQTEQIMLSLRTAQGLSLTQYEQRFGTDALAMLLRQAKPHLSNGNLQKTGETLRLTRQSLFISDTVISDLLP